MYTAVVLAGLFDPEEGQGFTRLDTEVTAEQDSQEAARDAVILLKNDANTLPIPSGHGLNVLLTGPYASDQFSKAIAAVDNSANVSIVPGCTVSGHDTSGIPAAARAASDADVVILCLGSSAELEHEYHDRDNSSLPDVQSQLAKAVLGAV